MRNFLIALLCICCTFQLPSQSIEESVLNTFHWRNIGPANQGGRIVDIEAVDGDFRKVYMATGSGGVWYSRNAGTTWTPIFDKYTTASVGDIAIYQQNPNIIWVGTGEANNRNSVSWGDGIFKSIDGGKTFTNMGLNSTHQIARVVTFQDNPDEVCVCAIGHLWGTTGDRGLFKTTNGGNTWEKLTNGLPDDGVTGCTDLIVNPDNPRIMYAAFYQRLRKPWTFHSGGLNGGIFKTTNAGKSWKKLTNGLPTDSTGRIGLDIYRSDPKILMAIVEAKRTDTLDVPGSGIYRSEDGGKSWTYTSTYNNRPFYYSQIRINPLDDKKVYVLTTRFMASEDGGKTFKNGSEDQEVHGDFHAMWLDPDDRNRYYLGADKGISLTHDGGDNFMLFDNLPIAQYYRISYDFRDPYYVYGGLQDNGFYATASFSRDIRGILNDSNWKVHWGDGQYSAVDPDNWRTMITSAENGAVWSYDPLTYRIQSIRPTIRNTTNISEHLSTEQMNSDEPFRFNWSAPLLMAHKSKHLYLAGNHILKSEDMGTTWTIISPDLSSKAPEKTVRDASGGLTPDNTGAETHCTVVALALSPLDENILWAGTDDGMVHLTTDGGKSWEAVRGNFTGVPQETWVSRIEASSHGIERAYISFDGHRSDNNSPYLFVTEDFGKSWKSLTASLPEDEVVRVVRENPFNENFLVIGTETGVWASLDRGTAWFRFMPGMPTVSVYDLAFHPRDHDLIAGTHGRSLWVLDNVQAFEQFSGDIADKPVHLFEQPVATLWENTSRGGQRGHFWFAGENPEEIRPVSSLPRARFEVDALIYYSIGAIDTSTLVELIISDSLGNTSIDTLKVVRGIHKFLWNREFDAQPYTASEEELLHKTLNQALANRPDRAESNAYKRYLTAENTYERRRGVEALNRAFDLGLDDAFGISRAGPGGYSVILRAGPYGEVMTTLRIRMDPLVNAEE